MNYLLVLQFPCKSEKDLDLLIEMEDKLDACIESTSEVDGHDIGRDEMNLFIYSSEPTACFKQAKLLLCDMVAINTMKAAFRHLDSNEYTVLWPEELENFEVQ